MSLAGLKKNLEVDPPRRLVQSFRALWSGDVKREGTSRVTWEIEPVGDSCRLTVVHDQLREGANSELYGGWPMVLIPPLPPDRGDESGSHSRTYLPAGVCSAHRRLALRALGQYDLLEVIRCHPLIWP